jgi:hypothetical protein
MFFYLFCSLKDWNCHHMEKEKKYEKRKRWIVWEKNN